MNGSGHCVHGDPIYVMHSKVEVRRGNRSATFRIIPFATVVIRRARRVRSC